VDALDELRVEERYQYVSLHAPSRIAADAEENVVGMLQRAARRGWPIIVHPGVMRTPELWRCLGSQLCIENMDRRSRDARTCTELERLFKKHPEATFCIDLGHVRQIDTSMVEAYRMLTRLRDRLRQVHLSEVTWAGRHAPISYTAKLAFRAVAELMPVDVPIVIESVLGDPSTVGPERVAAELHAAEEALTPTGDRRCHAAAE
jgi:hypothetical protein